MATIDHTEWNVLGYFHYHDHAVVLKASPKEDDYIVIKMYRRGQEPPIHSDRIGKAQDLFTTEVSSILNYTSSSDVSMYMQQRSNTESPQFKHLVLNQ